MFKTKKNLYESSITKLEILKMASIRPSFKTSLCTYFSCVLISSGKMFAWLYWVFWGLLLALFPFCALVLHNCPASVSLAPPCSICLSSQSAPSLSLPPVHCCFINLVFIQVLVFSSVLFSKVNIICSVCATSFCCLLSLFCLSELEIKILFFSIALPMFRSTCPAPNNNTGSRKSLFTVFWVLWPLLSFHTHFEEGGGGGERYSHGLNLQLHQYAIISYTLACI